ncbi:MAG: oligosaccharide flippase family protein [Bacteroidales bacterium]
MSETKEYKNIFKATSLFGGVQVLQVLLNLVRGKIIAVLLGATGMGVNSLFFSTANMVNNFTGMGLNFSAVREIAEAKQSEDKLSRVVKIFRRWLLVTASLGLVIMVVFSPLLSAYTFKEKVEGITNDSYFIIAFALLGFMVFFNTLSTGNAAILQGARKLKKFALYSLTGTLSALVISIPLYYLFGIKGILPALILSTFVTYVFSVYYTKEIKSSKVKFSPREIYSGGIGMLKLGVTMMVSTALASVAHYMLNTFISSYGSLSDLGLYQAGMSITSQSIGLVFTAMAVDYYPRLSAVCSNNDKVRETANQQGVITMLVATPVLLLLSLLLPFVIKILLSQEFLPIINFVRLLAFGMLFKAASYSIGTISFAKGDKKVFFLLEGIYVNVSIFVFSAVGYTLGGLEGLALFFLLMHLVYFILVLVVNYKLYSFYLESYLIKIIAISILFTGSNYLVLKFLGGTYAYVIASGVVIASLIYSVLKLNKLIGIKEMLSKVLKKDK